MSAIGLRLPPPCHVVRAVSLRLRLLGRMKMAALEQGGHRVEIQPT